MYSTQSKPAFLRDRILQYFQLTKPRIVVLLALTGIVALFLPATGSPPSFTVVLTFLMCGYFTAGGAMAINNAIDIDIDKQMARTSNRPSIEKLSPLHVTTFGTTLVVLGVVIAYSVFGWFTVIFLAWGALFYIFGYSLILKRSTVFNTILGGLASPAPVWAAFAARAELAGSIPPGSFLGVPPTGWLLGLLVYLWTPTHTWAMAAKNFDDYVNADIPMLPVVLGLRKTAWITAIGSVLVMAFASWLVLFMFPNRVWISIWLNIPFLLAGLAFIRRPTPEYGTYNFHAHNLWLAATFMLFL